MRTPFCPTHAPIGSTLGSEELTATLERTPGKRATDSTFTTPARTSGISKSNNFSTNLGLRREINKRGPRDSLITLSR